MRVSILSPVYAALFFWNDSGDYYRQALVFFVSCVYAVRLNSNYFRNEGWGFIGYEDWRYVSMRQWLLERGVGWLFPSFVLVYFLQWLMVYLASIPIFYVMTDSSPLAPRDALGAGITLGGMWLEFLADSHLKNFVTFERKRGQIMQKGLWALSRHPNYVGECIVWFGFGLWGYLSGSGVLVALGTCNVFVVVWFYSMDAMEQRMLNVPSRRLAYERYQRSTSTFLPWRR
jgi:steroid 5-alpha reductase family enzyme